MLSGYSVDIKYTPENLWLKLIGVLAWIYIITFKNSQCRERFPCSLVYRQQYLRNDDQLLFSLFSASCFRSMSASLNFSVRTSPRSGFIHNRRERQKWPRDHDFPAIFRVCRLPFQRENRLFRVCRLSENYVSISSFFLIHIKELIVKNKYPNDFSGKSYYRAN